MCERCVACDAACGLDTTRICVTLAGMFLFGNVLRQSWKERWFELEEGVMAYYVDDGGKYKGQVCAAVCKAQIASWCAVRVAFRCGTHFHH